MIYITPCPQLCLAILCLFATSWKIQNDLLMRQICVKFGFHTIVEIVTLGPGLPGIPICPYEDMACFSILEGMNFYFKALEYLEYSSPFFQGAQ